jgi:transcriptional regulator with XRE-family HTH domain
MSDRHPKTWRSEGSKALKKYLENHLGLKDLAIKTGFRRDVLSRWSNGKRMPDAEQMLKLQDDIGIPCAAWGMRLGEESGAQPATKSRAVA